MGWMDALVGLGWVLHFYMNVCEGVVSGQNRSRSCCGGVDMAGVRSKCSVQSTLIRHT